MARKAMIEKEKRRQKMVEAHKQKRAFLKARSIDMSISDEERAKARIGLNKMSPNSSKVRVRNRCQLTGRSRGYMRKFAISRICFREMANSGLIPGVTKASW